MRETHLLPERIAPERTPAFVAARTLNKTIAAVDCQGMMVESAGAGHAWLDAGTWLEQRTAVEIGDGRTSEFRVVTTTLRQKEHVKKALTKGIIWLCYMHTVHVITYMQHCADLKIKPVILMWRGVGRRGVVKCNLELRRVMKQICSFFLFRFFNF